MTSKIRYTELYDTIPAGHVSLDSKGLVLEANLTLADMLSMERSSLLRHPFKNHIVLSDQEIYFNYLKNLDRPTSEKACELRLKKNDGTILDVMIKATRIADKFRRPERYRIIIIDASEQKIKEKEHTRIQEKVYHSNKMESIRTMAGGIAHDFNNILHIIIGLIELSLNDIPKWNRSHTNLKKVRTIAFKAADIVKKLNYLSSGIDQEFKPTDVVDSIEEVLEILSPSIPAAIEIRCYFPDLEMIILADQNQLNRLLMNIFTNALQAIPGSGGILEIRAESEFLSDADILSHIDLNPGAYVKISIRDTGSGIAPEIIDRIFDPYFTTRGLATASGMGLTIAQAIVKNHKGDITVAGRPGQGAIFTLLFPMIKDTPDDEL